MTSGVYVITNKIDGSRYVGGSINCEKRRSEHFRALRRVRHHNFRLQAAFDLHGESAFDFAIIAECRPETVASLEQKALDNYAPEYNIAQFVGTVVGVTVVPEVRAKIRSANLGNTCSPETIEKIRMAKTGTRHTEETREKMREAHSTRPRRPTAEATRLKIAEVQLGKKRGPYKPRSPEHSAKIAAALRGRKFGPRAKAATESNRLLHSRARHQSQPTTSIATPAIGLPLISSIRRNLP